MLRAIDIQDGKTSSPKVGYFIIRITGKPGPSLRLAEVSDPWSRAWLARQYVGSKTLGWPELMTHIELCRPLVGVAVRAPCKYLKDHWPRRHIQSIMLLAHPGDRLLGLHTSTSARSQNTSSGPVRSALRKPNEHVLYIVQWKDVLPGSSSLRSVQGFSVRRKPKDTPVQRSMLALGDVLINLLYCMRFSGCSWFLQVEKNSLPSEDVKAYR